MGWLSRNDWVILAAAVLGATATLIAGWSNRTSPAKSSPEPSVSVVRTPLGILPLRRREGASEILHLDGWSSLRGQHHYLVVESPQGDLCLQDREISLGVDGNWSGTVQLGQADVGNGEAYTVFLVASPNELKDEDVTDHLPDGVTISGAVRVVRRADSDESGEP